jgi:hypothetical protein
MKETVALLLFAILMLSFRVRWQGQVAIIREVCFGVDVSVSVCRL